MMRGREHCAVAVRKPSGEVVVASRAINSLLQRHRWLDKPVLRGSFALYDTLHLGLWSIHYSAGAILERPASRWTGIVAAVMAILLFLILPERTAHLSRGWFHSSYTLNVFEGLVRAAIFVLYFAAISLLADIRRIYRYHGAEHRAVNALEAGAPLTVESVQRFSSIHYRCGTNFVMVVMIVALVTYALLPWRSFVERVGLRLLLLPLIAGVSYELIKAASKHPKSPLLRLLVAPGLALQRLTTGTPDDAQVEVAIRALQEVRRREEGVAGSKLGSE